MTDDAQAAPATPPATPEDLFRRLEALGIETATHRHRPVFTVEESRDLRGQIPGTHCKSLFVRNKKGAMWLVVSRETRKLDIKALAELIGSGRLSFGSPDRLMKYLGVIPGSVTPFAVINDAEGAVKVVLDADVMAADLANFHPLQNDMTTAIRPADLKRFIEACGHDPVIVDLGPATTGWEE